MLSGKRKNSNISISLSSACFVIGAIALLFVSSSYIKIFLQKRAVQHEIDLLKQEKDKLEANNKDLSGLLDYFASASYKEREMRLRLNMQKEGEKTIIISRESDKAKGSGPASAGAKKENVSNFKKWWNYFFEK